MQQPPKINILTSCDNALAKYLLPQLAAVGDSLGGYAVDFYLMHNRISRENLQLIKAYVRTIPNISLHVLPVEDNALFERLAGCGGRWPPEAYYWLLSHLYLPRDVDRVLCIDAGDIIIRADIAEYYYQDFKECALVATAEQVIAHGGGYRFYNRGDLRDPRAFENITGRGILNSGSIVLNVEKLRQIALHERTLLCAVDELMRLLPGKKDLYFGDQGLASFLFIGDIMFFSNPQNIDPWYMPYNFCLWFFSQNEMPWYTPAIVHYTGIFYKPWEIRFDKRVVVERACRAGDDVRYPYRIKPATLDYYELWWKYCERTPIYEKADRQAKGVARKLLRFSEDTDKLSWNKGPDLR